MQHGPYGITSSPNIFMAIYRAVSMLHTEIISLGFARPKTIPEGLIQSLKGFLRKINLILKITHIFFFCRTFAST